MDVPTDLTLPPFLDRRPSTMAKTKAEASEAAHSPLGPSSMYRWANCAGSVNLIRKLALPDEPSEYAAEGTVAHEVAAKCLDKGQDTWEYAGQKLTADGFEFEVDDEMVEGVQLYLDTIREDIGESEGPWFAERRVGLSGHDDLNGTLDGGLISGSLLRVYDLKYGKGIVVEAENNEQGLCYAAYLLDEVSENHPEIEEIEIVIVQPRAFHAFGPVRRWRLSVTALGEWVETTLLPAAQRTKDPDAPLAAGEWCRFCPARTACPKLMGRARELFEELEEKDPGPDDISAMEDWELGEMLDLQARVTKFFADVKTEALNRLVRGGEVPGQKLVRQTVHRVWKDGAEADAEKKFGDEAFTRKFVSPAGMEKLGEAGKAFAAKWGHKPEANLTMAPLSDRREAVSVQEINPEVAFDGV